MNPARFVTRRGPRDRAPPRRSVVLFLAANPSGTTRLALDAECSAIERALRMASGRDDFEFHAKWMVGVDDMMGHLNDLQPDIIHFSGHGGGSDGVRVEGSAGPPGEARRDFIDSATAGAGGGAGCAVGAAAGGGEGIVLHGDDRAAQHVTAAALAQMIGSAANSTRLVVLNACYSDTMAEPLSRVVGCVVGMRGAIGDISARAFAVGFYRALASRRSVANAVEQAIATINGKQLPDADQPVCRTGPGVRADQLVLASGPAAS